MEITARSLITLFHGMGFGALFLLAFSGAMFELGRTEQGNAPGGERHIQIYLVLMTLLAWLTVLSGAYIVYPWYRAVAPAGTADLSAYPQLFLKAKPNTIGWHSFGMEWKEHIAWLAPISITMITVVYFHYGNQLRRHLDLRRAVLTFVGIAFFAAALAGFFGAMIDKNAPVQGGHIFHLFHGA